MAEQLKESTNQEFINLAAQYRDIKEEIDALSVEEKRLKAALTDLAGTDSVQAEGVKVFVYEVWEKKQTPAQYVKEHKIRLQVTELDQPEYSYRITMEKRDG